MNGEPLDNFSRTIGILHDRIKKLKTYFPEIFMEGRIEIEKFKATFTDVISFNNERSFGRVIKRIINNGELVFAVESMNQATVDNMISRDVNPKKVIALDSFQRQRPVENQDGIENAGYGGLI
jgi:hypothetical protein